MAKRILISVVPDNFMTDPFDEIGLGYQAHLISEQMVKAGLTPYSALEVFKQAQGFAPRVLARPSYVILGEVVSKAQYALWRRDVASGRPGAWLRLLIDNVTAQDRKNDCLERPSRLLPDICKDIRYWRLCNARPDGVFKYRPELVRAGTGGKS